MADMCINELNVSGDKESMDKFFKVLNSEGNNNFQMSKFLPIPKVLNDNYPFRKFKACNTKTVKLKGGEIKEIEIDSNNRTEDEFQKFKAKLRKNFGYDNDYDWCKANWGCSEDISEEMGYYVDNQNYSVKYMTKWCPNINFVIYLHKRYPNLSFTLEFLQSADFYAGTLTITPDSIELVEEPYSEICFGYNNDSGKYYFDQEYEGKDWVDVIGKNWIDILAEYDFTSETVENWNELVEHFEYHLGDKKE